MRSKRAWAVIAAVLITVAARPAPGAAKSEATQAPTATRWLLGADGGVFSAESPFYGSTASMRLNQPIFGGVATRSARGYWLFAKDGGVFAFGDAPFLGSMGMAIRACPARAPCTLHVRDDFSAAAGLRTKDGYLLATKLGHATEFVAGEQPRGASPTSPPRMNQPVVAIAPTRFDNGHWLFAADGGVFSQNAPFFGSAAAAPLNAPIVAAAATDTGFGYWLFAADGGVFAFGDAPFLGSATGQMLPHRLVVGATPNPDGSGYLLVDDVGEVYAFGTARCRISEETDDGAPRFTSCPTTSAHRNAPYVGVIASRRPLSRAEVASGTTIDATSLEGGPGV